MYEITDTTKTTALTKQQDSVLLLNDNFKSSLMTFMPAFKDKLVRF